LSKYSAQKVGNFSSKLEANIYNILLNRQDAGELKDIQCQSKVYLTDARILLIVDFKAVVAATGKDLWIEAKGMPTPVWAIKKRLWKYYGPGKLEIWAGRHTRPFLSEVVG
jgi:hypothetical protein